MKAGVEVRAEQKSIPSRQVSFLRQTSANPFKASFFASSQQQQQQQQQQRQKLLCFSQSVTKRAFGTLPDASLLQHLSCPVSLLSVYATNLSHMHAPYKTQVPNPLPTTLLKL